MTWWSDAAYVYFALTRISREWKKGGGDTAPWSVAGFDFRLSHRDVMAHDHELEEQLWAMRQGFA